MSEIINELLEKLKQCDDFHNRCDFLMEHSEITYMLDYITNLQQENQELQNRINIAIEYIEKCLKQTPIENRTKTDDTLDIEYEYILKILKEDE